MAKNDKAHAEIGQRLRRFREVVTKLKQKEFANQNGFQDTRYTNWETGERRIPPEHAMALCEKYGLTLDYIYRGRVNTLPLDLAVKLQ